jgi:hypothetical protein
MSTELTHAKPGELAMSSAEYHAAPGLSASGMKDLMVSPLRYWHLHINPKRPIQEETPAQRIGTALHCAVLEPERFEAEYVRELVPGNDWLDTIEDLRAFLRDKGIKPAGTRKAEVIAQVQAYDPNYPIVSVQFDIHADLHKGKIGLAVDEWVRVNQMRDALKSEPRFNAITKEGHSEVSLFATDPNSGVPLKARLDWINGSTILDVKTFSQMRGKSIDQTVADAIFYEAYYRQFWLYNWVRHLAAPVALPRFVVAFVESEEPHETRLKSITVDDSTLYSQRARTECNALMWLYADHEKRFGADPWRSAQEVDPLIDEDLKQIFF